jgi:hypothetical protein
MADEVIADAVSQVEPVEALRCQHREIVRPHLCVVVPGLVFYLAGEEPRYAAYLVSRTLCMARNSGDSDERIA